MCNYKAVGLFLAMFSISGAATAELVSANSLHLGQVKTGSIVTRGVELRNTEATAVDITNITYPSGVSGDMSTFPVTVPPEGSITVNVTYDSSDTSVASVDGIASVTDEVKITYGDTAEELSLAFSASVMSLDPGWYQKGVFYHEQYGGGDEQDSGLFGTAKLTEDGSQLLVILPVPNTFSIFDRNTVTGELTKRNVFMLNERDILLSTSIDISPGGDQILLTGYDNNKIVAYSRNVGSGEITFDSTYSMPSSLDGTHSLVYSPSGDQVIVLGVSSDSIAVFDRQTDGTLIEPPEIYENGREIGDLTTISDLNSPASIVFSPDGKQVIVSNFDNELFVLFDRVNGQLVNHRVVDSFGFMSSPPVFTQRGDRLYFSSETVQGQVFSYKRNPITGVFIKDAENNIEKDVYDFSDDFNTSLPIGAPILSLSNSNKWLFIASDNDSQTGLRVVNIDADEAFGELEIGFVNDNEGIKGLSLSGEVVSSPSGDQFYVLSAEAISYFERDSDGDLIRDGLDRFPENIAASVDADDDGLVDAWNANCDATCQSASGLTLDASLNDTDNDGVINSEDDFPNDPLKGDADDIDNDGVENVEDAFPDNVAASVDADNDGLVDAWNANCDVTCQSASGLTLDASLNDTDNDGVINSEDAFPNDPTQSEQVTPDPVVPEPSGGSGGGGLNFMMFGLFVMLTVLRKRRHLQ